MNIPALVFRIRVWLFLALYLLGFFAPWEALWRPSGARPGTLWLAASALLARTGAVGLSTATYIVTVFVLICLAMGAVLRVCGTAYLGANVMGGRSMRGERVVAAGPYRVVRNPLYLGSWLFAVGVSFLMPPTGALFFVLTHGALMLFLIRGEERFLLAQQGSAYEEYRRRVPRVIPRLFPRSPETGADTASSAIRPRWFQGLSAEVMVVGFTICFALFAWRYNVQLLLRCLLICFGARLVVRGMRSNRQNALK